MLRLEGKFIEDKLIIGGIEEVELTIPTLDAKLRAKGYVCEYFQDRDELSVWVRQYKVRISRDYIGLAVGVSKVFGFGFLVVQ